jgi:hypothetical protein
MQLQSAWDISKLRVCQNLCEDNANFPRIKRTSRLSPLEMSIDIGSDPFLAGNNNMAGSSCIDRKRSKLISLLRTRRTMVVIIYDRNIIPRT